MHFHFQQSECQWFSKKLVKCSRDVVGMVSAIMILLNTILLAYILLPANSEHTTYCETSNADLQYNI